MERDKGITYSGYKRNLAVARPTFGHFKVNFINSHHTAHCTRHAPHAAPRTACVAQQCVGHGRSRALFTKIHQAPPKFSNAFRSRFTSRSTKLVPSASCRRLVGASCRRGVLSCRVHAVMLARVGKEVPRCGTRMATLGWPALRQACCGFVEGLPTRVLSSAPTHSSASASAPTHSSASASATSSSGNSRCGC